MQCKCLIQHSVLLHTHLRCQVHLAFFCNRCYRQFTVQPNTELVVKCDLFKVQGGNGCSKDQVRLSWLFDGSYTDYCGNGALKQGVRTEAKEEAYQFWFDFESDGRRAFPGFRCHVIGESVEGSSATTTEAPTEPPTTAGPGTTSAPGGKVNPVHK